MAQTAAAVFSPINKSLRSKAEKLFALCGNPVTEQRSAFSPAALSWVGLVWSAGSSALVF